MTNEWKQGYEDGKVKSLSLNRPFKTEDFPEEFTHRGSDYSRGFSEGVLRGENIKHYGS